MTDPKIAKDLHRELQGLIGHLVELGMVDRQHFPSIQTGSNGEWTVAQPGASLSLSLKKRPYEEIYLELAGSKSYSMLLLDGALLQFAYSGVHESIMRHRLAYFPSPTLEPYQNDPDLYLRELHFVDIVGYQVVPVPVRFDFDIREGVAVDMLHPAAHLTLGQYQHCRVPISRPASPSEFTEFIIQSFYSTPDMAPLALHQHLAQLPTTITKAESQKVHIAMPGTRYQ